MNEIKVVGETITMRLGNQNPEHVPMDKELLKAEFSNLVEYLFKGGNMGQHGEVASVLGIHIQVAVLSSIEAPQETWAKLKELQDVAKPDSAVSVPRSPRNRDERRHQAHGLNKAAAENPVN